MKKVLSILLSVAMLVGCAVAMIPAANAAVKTPERFPEAKRGAIIYSQDFEGDEVVAASDNAAALFAALGWGGTGYSGISIVTDEESDNHRLQIDGRNESMIVCKDDRLVGGGYIVEYTAIMSGVDTSDGSGMGFRSSYDIKEAGWNFLAKERGNFDFHFHAKDVAKGNYHSEQDIAPEALEDVNGMAKPNGSIYGKEIRFRLVIDPVNGLSAYTIDLETGEATIVVGMNAEKVFSWAASAHTLNDELIIRTIGSTKHLVDDIAIYEADLKSYAVPAVFGYQTTDLSGDTYDVRFLAKLDKKNDAVGVGYRIEYRYLDENNMVHKGKKDVSCKYVYSSITADNGQDVISYEDFKIVALHLEDVPTTYDIVFTVTPYSSFWSDFGSTEVKEYGDPVSFSVQIPD